MDKVAIDFDAKTATVTMKEGALTKESVEAAFKGTRYSMASFEPVAAPPPKTYTITVSGMT